MDGPAAQIGNISRREGYRVSMPDDHADRLREGAHTHDGWWNSLRLGDIGGEPTGDAFDPDDLSRQYLGIWPRLGRREKERGRHRVHGAIGLGPFRLSM